MKALVFMLACTVGAWVFAQDQAYEAYTINADDIQIDENNNSITYKGNAEVAVSNLIIKADVISIYKQGGWPSKITAVGNPIRFYEREPKQNINGTAQQVTFLLSELKLTLIDYSITDPNGNNMKGKKASFVLAP